MPSMVTPTTGQVVVAEMWAQLTEAWSGLRNIPMALTGVNDNTNYAQTIKNAGTGSKAQVIYAADGTTILLKVDGTGVIASSGGGAAGTIVNTADTQTLSGKTLTGPHMTTPVVDSGGLTITAGDVAASASVMT